MRISLLALCLVAFSCNNDEEPRNVSKPNAPVAWDSASIRNSFAASPFSINAYDYLAELMKGKKIIDTQLRPNIHDESITDTIKLVEWKNSSLQTLNNKNLEKPVLLSASINDPEVKFTNGFQVGDDADKIFKTFNIYFDRSKTYKYLQVVSDQGAEDIVTFNFKDNKVWSIFYLPVVD